MSALGQKRTCAVHNGMSALPLKADMCAAKANVRYGSKADSCSATRHVRFTPNSDRESRHSRVEFAHLERFPRHNAEFRHSRDHRRIRRSWWSIAAHQFGHKVEIAFRSHGENDRLRFVGHAEAGLANLAPVDDLSRNPGHRDNG